MSDGVREWVEAAVRGLGPPECRACGEEESQTLNRAVAATFVRGSPRVWWLGLTRVDGRGSYDDFPQEMDRLSRYMVLVKVRETDRVWFLPDPDDRRGLPVYEATFGSVLRILGDTPRFEYYLAGLGMEWLVASTDHNEVLFCRKA